MLAIQKLKSEHFFVSFFHIEPIAAGDAEEIERWKKEERNGSTNIHKKVKPTERRKRKPSNNTFFSSLFRISR